MKKRGNIFAPAFGRILNRPEQAGFVPFLIAALLLVSLSINAQFVPLGPQNGSNGFTSNYDGQGTGQIHCIAIAPDDTSYMFAGSPYCGLWKWIPSGGGAGTWQVVTAVEKLETNSVNDIEITGSQVTGYTIYICTGSSSRKNGIPSCGVYKSTDNGNTFQAVGTFNTQGCNVASTCVPGCGFNTYTNKLTTKLAVDPTNSQHIFVASSDGLYETTNGSTTWNIPTHPTDWELTSEPCLVTCTSYGNTVNTPGLWNVQFSPNFATNKVVYASGNGMYIFMNGAWTVQTPPIGCSLPGPTNQRNINFKAVNFFHSSGFSWDLLWCVSYTSCGNYSIYYASLLTTGGTTTISGWTQYNSSLPGSYQYLNDFIRIKLDVNPTNALNIAVGVTQAAISTLNGAGWTDIAAYFGSSGSEGHGDIHAFTWSPDGKFLLIGTDGGIYRYDAVTGVTSARNNGLAASWPTTMSTSRLLKGHIAIGNQDTGEDWFDGINWHQIDDPGDGYPATYWDLSDPNKFYFQTDENESEEDITTGYTNLNISACNSDMGLVMQNPNTEFTNEFFGITGNGGNTLYYTDATQHCTGFQLVQDLHSVDIWAVGLNTLSRATNAPQTMYATTYVFGYWNSGHVWKFNSDEYSLISASGCTNSAPCNGTDCFEDLKFLPGCQNWDYATSVAVSSNNPDKIWVSLSYASWEDVLRNSGSCSGCTDPKHHVIRKFDPSANTWSDDAAGLPTIPNTSMPYPIQQIIYLEGSNDGLFCATQNGRIFYKDATMSSWHEVDPTFPHTEIVSMEINYCTRTLYVATQGRGIFSLNLENYFNTTTGVNPTLTISQNTVWQSGYYNIGHNIIIKSGSTLEINGTNYNTVVNMCKDCNITVEPGAKLIVDHATLTNSCGDQWGGIIVEGNPSARQVDVDSLNSFTGAQGVCIVRGYSTVEYMANGITSGTDNPLLNEYNGGQIIADNSYFLNNYISIAYNPYTPPADPNNPLLYSKQKISNCGFNNTSMALYTDVSMIKVRGIIISGDTFNFQGSPQAVTLPPTGILAQQSEFDVMNDATTHNINQFKNLAYAIRVIDGLNLSYGNFDTIGIKIDSAEFYLNQYGIYLIGTQYAHVTQNTFDIANLCGCKLCDDPRTSGCTSFGIYLYESSSYKIQENTMFSSQSSTGANFGILVDDDEAANELIRNNTISNQEYGLTAVGINSDILAGGYDGLFFQCNTLNQNFYWDIGVVQKTFAPHISVGSIRFYQGDIGCNPDLTANNTFHPLNSTTPLFQLYKDVPSYGYKYMSSNAYPYAPSRISPSIFINPCYITPECPSEVIPLDWQLPDMLSIQTQASQLKSEIDGGEPEALKLLIENATQYNIGDMYDTLLGYSVLSDDVLAKAISSPYANLETQKLKSLLLQNSGLSNDLLELLGKESIRFTSTDYAELKSAQNNISPYHRAGAQISAIQNTIESSMLGKVRQLISTGNPDSAITLMKTFETPSILTHLATMALRWGKYDVATAAVQKLVDDYNIGANMKKFIDLANNLRQQHKEWESADSAVIKQLYEIRSKGDWGAGLAESALALAADTLFAPYFPGHEPNYIHTDLVNEQYKAAGTDKSQLEVQPNPANEIVNIYFNMPESVQVNIEISDALGNVKEIKNIGQNSGVLNLDVSNWQSGVYVVNAVGANGTALQFGKFAVQHL